jgi:hypothetical protein
MLAALPLGSLGSVMSHVKERLVAKNGSRLDDTATYTDSRLELLPPPVLVQIMRHYQECNAENASEPDSEYQCGQGQPTGPNGQGQPTGPNDVRLRVLNFFREHDDSDAGGTILMCRAHLGISETAAEQAVDYLRGTRGTFTPQSTTTTTR